MHTSTPKTSSDWFQELQDLLTEYEISPRDLTLGEDGDGIPEIFDNRDEYDDFSDELPNFFSDLCIVGEDLRTKWIPQWFETL